MFILNIIVNDYPKYNILNVCIILYYNVFHSIITKLIYRSKTILLLIIYYICIMMTIQNLKKIKIQSQEQYIHIIYGILIVNNIPL